ncbi:BspA family leucine-rich repeat surface protein [Shivajiella indica]|uniref:BspA family leucine-rich repeat surface protein n=1 Tax=Shivajiella indica TaxID=872115 RepID=A0ABW5B691_9BACT
MKKTSNLFQILLVLILISCFNEEPKTTFKLDTSASPAEGGRINLMPKFDSYDEGKTVKLTAEAYTDWVFQKWDGDADGSSNPLEITMDSDKSIIGLFVKRSYPLNLLIIGEGTVNEVVVPNPSGREYPIGTTVELTPVPKEGWAFQNWEGDLSGNQNPMRILVDGTKNVQVKFVPKPEGEPRFFLAENGVTCKCEGVIPGYKGIINGVEYEAVDNEFLKMRVEEKADLTKLCTSLVTDLSYLGLSTDFNQPIGNWDVSNVTDMSYLFAANFLLDWNLDPKPSQFNQPLEHWDVSKVTNMNTMFGVSLFNQPIEAWDVSNVTDMSFMFYGAVFNQPIENWDVGKVTNMSHMFGSLPDVYNARFNQPIGKWNVSNVELMTGMFNGNYYFNQDLSSWCVIKIPTIPEDFYTGSWTLPKPVWGTCPD